MNQANSRLFVFGLSLFFGAHAFAQAVVEKDWAQEKKVHSLTTVVSCVASTVKSQSSLQVTTEIILPENDEKVPLIVIKAKGLKGSIPRAHVRPDSRTQYPMLLLSSNAVLDEDTFVLSPMRMPEVLDIIAAKNTLDVYFGEGNTAILARISLKGSSKSINRNANCRISKTLWKDRLFKELKADPQLATVLTGSVQDLLVSYQKTLDSINASEKAQAALNFELQVGQSLLSQERLAQQVLAASKKAVLDTQNQISLLQKRIVDLNNAIASAQIDLPQLQADRPGAQQDLSRAQSSLRNVESEVRRLENEINIAQSRESQIRSSIDTIQSQINSLQIQISQQQNQADLLRQDQNSRQNDINRLNNQKAQLEQNYRLFDINRRADDILRSNINYRNQQALLQNLTNRKLELQGEVKAADNLVKELTRAVKDCEAAVDSSIDQCAQLKNQLLVAQNELIEKQNEAKEVDRKANDTNIQLRNMEASARQQAINEKDRIAVDINRVQQSINQLQSDISIVDRQISSIIQIDIPRSQNSLNAKRSDLAIAQNSLAQASADVRRAQANLVNYKSSVGYDRLVNNVRVAQSRLNSIDQKIVQAQSTLSKAPTQITASEVELIKQQNLLAERQAAIPAAQVRVNDVHAAVVTQQVKEQVARDQLGIILGDLQSAKRATQGLSKSLYGF